jgi:hypothetical protein
MLSEDLAVLNHLSERMEKVFHGPKGQKQKLALKNDQVIPRPVFCEFYSKLPCTLPHAIYSVCQRCSRAFMKQGIVPYEPKVDVKNLYEKIVSLSFFFTEKKNLTIS